MADVNCDGKLDINEFSVACKLVTMKLKGMEIPPALPPALRAILVGSGQTTPVLSPQLSTGMVTPPGVMSPPLIRPTMSGGATPPLQPIMGVVAPTSVGVGMPQPMLGAIPGVPTSNIVGAMPPSANSVPPQSLAFRSATPPVSGNLIANVSILMNLSSFRISRTYWYVQVQLGQHLSLVMILCKLEFCEPNAEKCGNLQFLFLLI